MAEYTIEEAQASLPELIAQLAPGEECVIICAVARLRAIGNEFPTARKAGSAKGILTIVSDDDEHLDDFAEYLNE